ncbi:Ubiquinone/menaquinone biosynthesis C-methyltransferase UbiE [uncultured archaeon]|nr:Ubiquinone/menaquinone biosynthesis C-methyltransferase UbiE [uncultured archaeon]
MVIKLRGRAYYYLLDGFVPVDRKMEILLGRKEAADYLKIQPPQKILDVATGTGALAYELAKLGHSVIGIDISMEKLNQARKKCSDNLDLYFQQADATHLPFNNNEFDATSISFGLHDMPYETEINVLKEMKRVTKTDGKILIVDYNEPKNHWAAKLAYPLIKTGESVNWTPFITRGLENLLNKAGLKVAKWTTILGVIQIVIADNHKGH